MIKRMLSLILTTALLISLTSCGAQTASVSPDSSASDASQKTESEALDSSSGGTAADDSSDLAVGDEKSAKFAAGDEESVRPVAGDENLILTGTFENGTDGWNTYLEGGSAEFGIKDGAMNLDISNVGRVDYGVQLYYDGFSVYENGIYEMQFDVSSTIERTLEWRIQINGGDYHAYASDKITVGPETQHISQTFTMAEPTDLAPRLCFNCGVSDGYTDDNPAHTIVFDNVSLCLTDDSGIAAVGSGDEGPAIRLNQVGYKKDMTKTAVITGSDEVSSYSVISTADASEPAFTGTASPAALNDASDETVQVLDFTEFDAEGEYYIQLEDGTTSPTFIISDSVYDDLGSGTLRFFELAECGIAVEDETFGHAACHTADARIYGTDTFIDVSGGWHDAGDYGRYTVAGAKAVADLLLTYEDFGDQSALETAKYELTWMLKMQDAETGGVYHKVTCANFPGFVMPEEETAELLVMPVSTTATGTFAAVMAMAAVDYEKTDGEFAEKCRKAALKAQTYLESVPADTTGFKNPSDVSTGEYGDTNDSDERFWALAQLYRATDDTKYLEEAGKYLVFGLGGNLGWAETSLYGIYAIARESTEENSLAQKASELLLTKADEFIKYADEDSYGSALGEDYVWGSNMTAANRGMTLLMAAQLSGDESYIQGAEKQLSYLLGCNATGYCFVTGFGETSPEHPHHRPSVARGVAEPGMLVGGPDAALEDPTAEGYLSGSAPAVCYIDNDQSYSTNEVTIYWNSPLVYLLAGI